MKVDDAVMTSKDWIVGRPARFMRGSNGVPRERGAHVEAYIYWPIELCPLAVVVYDGGLQIITERKRAEALVIMLESMVAEIRAHLEKTEGKEP